MGREVDETFLPPKETDSAFLRYLDLDLELKKKKDNFYSIFCFFFPLNIIPEFRKEKHEVLLYHRNIIVTHRGNILVIHYCNYHSVSPLS